MKRLILLLLILAPAFTAGRPRLHGIGGSSEPVEIFWLGNDSWPFSNGTVAPGRPGAVAFTF